MTTRTLFTRGIGNTLVPADPAALELVQSIKPGGSLWLRGNRARNPRRHRLFWALVQIIKENTDARQSPDAIADYLKIRGGHVEVFKRPGGEVVEVPKSISFSRCSESEFKSFIDRLMDVIRTEIIPGLDEGDLRRELEAIAGDKEAA